MAVVQSYGALAKIEAAPTGISTTYPTTWMLDVPKFATYAAIYRTQPAVRTVVDFLARNIAQLGYHVFRRVSDTDRVRLPTHELADWLEHPNPQMTRYRLFESLIQDLGIYFTAYWLKVRLPDRIGLVRLPPERVEVYGILMPEMFAWTQIDGTRVPLMPSEIVYFSGYNPINPIGGLSPLETLRQVLVEAIAASEYRAAYWANSAHVEGVIERPKDAPRWTQEQKQTWREQWQARFSGPARAGQTAVLDDGMSFKPISTTFKDAEFVASRKLGIEEVIRAYHIPPPMVGVLDHATFSNVEQQHRMLYQDTLGPWLDVPDGRIRAAAAPGLLRSEGHLRRVQHRREAEGLVRGAGRVAASALRPPDHDRQRRPRPAEPAVDEERPDDGRGRVLAEHRAGRRGGRRRRGARVDGPADAAGAGGRRGRRGRPNHSPHVDAGGTRGGISWQQISNPRTPATAC